MIPIEDLKEIIISQRHFLEKSNSGITREIMHEVKIVNSFAITMTGIRRCGKSTLLQQLVHQQKKWYYLNLEDPRLGGFELSDFMRVEKIMKELYDDKGVYFFDEIQTIPQWERFIRYLVDKKEKIVVTGSNASLLSKEFGTKLTGRHLQIELFPFSYSEFLKLKKEKPSQISFENYLMQGGFPEYLKQKNPAINQELLSDVVIKDVAVRYGIKNTTMLTKIAVYLISNVGKQFSYNSLKKMFEIKSIQSIIDYLSYFENAYLVFILPRFSYSFKQQQISQKKIYSIDTGFSCVNSASFSKDKGKMLENAVFLELRRKCKDLFYFLEKNECDFVVREGMKITHAYQVCYKLDDFNKEREIAGLIEALKMFKLDEGMIITSNQEDTLTVEGKKIILKPAWKWMLEHG